MKDSMASQWYCKLLNDEEIDQRQRFYPQTLVDMILGKQLVFTIRNNLEQERVQSIMSAAGEMQIN